MSSSRALALVCLAACAACSRERPKPDRTEPWPAPASVSASASGHTAAPRRAPYTLTKSRVEFELPARRATPRGRFRTVRGELDVDFEDPSRTSGSLEIELDSIELFREGAAEPAPDFTARALSWLELGPGVADERRRQGRIATFTLRGLQGGAPGSERRTLRTSDWSAKGDLAVHGVRAPVTAAVGLLVPPTTDGSALPRELVLRSRRPLVVSLNTHDIRPRDGNGVLLPRENSLLGDTVGREVRVTFELVFAPRS